MTSPTICASTATRISGVSPCSAASSASALASSVRKAPGSTLGAGASAVAVAVAAAAGPSPAAAVAPAGAAAAGWAWGARARRGTSTFELRADLADPRYQATLFFEARAASPDKRASVSAFFRAISASLSRWSAPTAASRSRMRCWTARSSINRTAVFDGGRRGALSQSQARAGGVQNTDGLIGKLASG